MTHFKETIDWYNRHARTYAQTTANNFQEERIEKFISLLPKHARVLDAGCGSGRDSRPFFEKGLEVIGIDASEELVSIARKNNPQIKCITGNFLSLPFTSNWFDGIWAHASLVHMDTHEDAEKALLEFHRVLKPGGLLYLYVRAQSGEEKTGLMDGRFYRYFSLEELKMLLQNAGFTVEKMTQKKEDDRGGKRIRNIVWITVFARKP